MMNNTTNIEDFFEQYDELATHVCSDTIPNIGSGVEHTNEQMCDEICEIEDVDHFDLFADLDPEAVMESGDSTITKSTAFKYLLRYQTFRTAEEYGVGDATFNELAIAHSELWYIKLTHKYAELCGVETDNTWMH